LDPIYQFPVRYRIQLKYGRSMQQTAAQYVAIKVKVISRQAGVAQAVSGRLRPRIISTFGTTKVVGRQPNAPTTFTPGEISVTHFQRLSRPQGTWFCRTEPRKKIPSDTTGIDPGTVRLVAITKLHISRNMQLVVSGKLKLCLD
jgi:hypothetical protein